MGIRFPRLALALPLALLPGSAAFAAAGYTISTIALEGSPAPGTPDAFGEFLDVALDGAGRVGFSAPLSSGFPNSGVWVDAGSGPVLRTRNGDAAPAPHAGSFIVFGGFTRLDGSGRAAYGAVLTGSVDGLFLDTAGADSVLVAEGNAAPVPPGGTLAASISSVGYFGMNAAGDVAFRSNVSGGSHPRGVFVRSAAGAVEMVAGAGDSVLGGPETYVSFNYPALNDAGSVAFEAVTSGGPASPGLFADTGGGFVALARAGDAAPDTGGGALVDFLYPAINSGDSVAFLSNVTGGSATGGLFVASPSGLVSVVVDGQTVAGAGPITTISSLPEIANDGSLAMSLAFGSGPVAGGVYVNSAGGFTPVALAGELAPGAGGAAFESFGFLSRNQTGRVAFVATLDDARTGVFLATPSAPPAVPLLTGPAIPILALLLAGTAVATLRRFSR